MFRALKIVINKVWDGHMSTGTGMWGWYQVTRPCQVPYCHGHYCACAGHWTDTTASQLWRDRRRDNIWHDSLGHYYHIQHTKMFSPNTDSSSLIAIETPNYTRAYSDPTIFRNDRVLRMLLKREVRLATTSKNYFSLQTELKPQMRKEVASWMLEVCEEEECSPQVFCLAVNYLDRFLSTCKIAK